MATRGQKQKPAQATKSVMGRPTKYDPAMCATVVELGEQGKSKAQIARSLGVHRETVNEWAKKHPDFSDAVHWAQELSLAWWEDQGQTGLFLGAKGFNSGLYAFQMKNRFKSDYRDTQDHNHGVTDELGALLERIDGRTRGIPEGN